MPKFNTNKEVIRVNGRLHEVVQVKDTKGNLLHKIINPLRVEFKPKDVMQVILGATILAIPVGFTEETWKLAAELPFLNVLLFMLISLSFISSFVYYTAYRGRFKQHWKEFAKRVSATYLLSFAIVAVLLGLLQLTPWATNWTLAFKRVVLVSFPASLSGAIADTLK